MVRYLPERVFCQFGWVQTIPRHPAQSAPVDVNLAEITNRFQRALDYALTPQELGETEVHGVEVADGYIEWFFQVSHPPMILPDMPVPRPPERELLDVQAAQDDGDLAYLQLSGRITHIKDHIYVVMRSGLVPKGTEEWQHLEDALREVHDGKIYRHRGATECGRGGGRGDGGTGVVIRG
jgi:hypothetical protein